MSSLLTRAALASTAIVSLAAGPRAGAAPAISGAAGRLTDDPSSEVTAPRGVFRVTLAEDGGVAIPATVIVEQRAGRVEATLLLDGSVTLLRVLYSDASSLRATVHTTDGAGDLVLRTEGSAVTGTLTARRHAWAVRGERSL